MIISILDTAFQAAMPTGFTYYSKPMWEFNYNDSPVNPVMLFALPFAATDSYTKVGIKRTRIVANIFFLKQTKLVDNQAIRTPIVDEMHDAMVQFMKNLETDTLVNNIFPEIRSVRYEDMYNVFDPNLDGISAVVDFEFSNTLC